MNNVWDNSGDVLEEPEVDKLNEAIKWTDAAIESGLMMEVKVASVIVDAAKQYAKIKPLLDEMISDNEDSELTHEEFSHNCNIVIKEIAEIMEV